jgi:hypothetical protein
MKKLLSLIILAFGLTALNSCDQPTTDSGIAIEPMGKAGGGTTTPAQPAIAGVGTKTTSKGTYYTVAVMDSTGDHLTNLYTTSYTGSPHPLARPTWSPNGGSISFVDGTRSGATITNLHLKRMDVTLVNGVPT